MFCRSSLVLALAVIGVPAISHAEPLSIEDALDAAAARNPVVAEGEALVAQARGRAVTAGQLVPSRPELQLAVRTDAPFAGDGEAGVDVAVSQELELFGQRGLRRRVAREDVGARRLDVDDRRRQLRAETRVAYYELMFQERRGALAAEVVETAQGLVEAAGRRVTAGDLGATELELLVADLALARSEQHGAVADLRVARAAMNRLIGRGPDAETSTRGEFPGSDPSTDVSAITARARAERADLAAAVRDVAAARAEVALRHRERLPNLTVSIGYAYDRGILARDEFSPPLQDHVRDVGHLFTVGLALPLPLLRSSAGEIAETKGRVAAAEARRAGVEARIGEEVAVAVARRDAARARIAELDAAALVVAATLERYEQAWAAKHVDLAQYLAVRDRVLAVRVSALEAHRDGAVADAVLERALGGGAR